MDKREPWLDYLRAFACILVSFGHLFMSFQEAAIIKDSVLVSFFVRTIYHFHVYIFFFCSGYLFQKVFSKYVDKRRYLTEKLVKSLDFIVIYVFFSGITYLIKVVLSGDVNSPVQHTFLDVLLKHPINQMWYMYAITLVILCSSVIRTDRTCIISLFVVLCLKVVTFIPDFAKVIPLPINYLFTNQIWFVFGAVWAYKAVVLKKWVTIAFALCFLIMSCFDFIFDINHAILNAVLTATAVLSCAELFRQSTQNKKMPLFLNYISKYMLQIYLLHTICAAGIRIVLLRFGVVDFVIHFLFGVLFSFVVPILCAMLVERTRFLNIVFFPSKTLKALKR